MEDKLTQKKVIEFTDFKSVDPSNLISFSKEYQDHLIFFRQFLKEKKGFMVTIVLARIDTNGNWSKKQITGTIKDLTDKNFIFVSDQDFFSQYDFERENLIHFDNVTGDVPMMTDFLSSPFNTDDSVLLSSYFSTLKKMKKLMEFCSQEQNDVHSAKLYFQTSRISSTLPSIGTRVIECKIKKVNRSNVEIYQVHDKRTWFNSNDYDIDIVPGQHTKKFVTPEQFLYKVEVDFTREAIANSIDDGEY